MGRWSPWSGAVSGAVLAAASGAGPAAYQELAPASSRAGQAEQRADAYV